MLSGPLLAAMVYRAGAIWSALLGVMPVAAPRTPRLQPVLVEGLANQLSLAGETRIVTLYHSDLANFSAVTEVLQPHELVPLTNEYLSEMTNIIMQRCGFVDKYIGAQSIVSSGLPSSLRWGLRGLQIVRVRSFSCVGLVARLIW